MAKLWILLILWLFSALVAIADVVSPPRYQPPLLGRLFAVSKSQEHAAEILAGFD